MATDATKQCRSLTEANSPSEQRVTGQTKIPDFLKQELKAIVRFPRLTPEQEKRLFDLLNDPCAPESARQDARTELINCNRRLVLFHAHRCKYVHGRLTIDELISAGDEGLIHSVDNFDPSQGTKFSTYASACILGAMSNDLDGQQHIHIPQEVLTAMRHYETVKQALTEHYGTVPTAQQLYKALQWTPEKWDTVRDAYNVSKALAYFSEIVEDCDDLISSSDDTSRAEFQELLCKIKTWAKQNLSPSKRSAFLAEINAEVNERRSTNIVRSGSHRTAFSRACTAALKDWDKIQNGGVLPEGEQA